ncbi:HMG box-containing protein 4 [Schistocerca americana]|uniref:HMG box-containing protein 4 n=1 Tax=Schistocerca americana TaxID=7009 RepID=UPI001F500FC1|nr:HMG box-containing protein 4 [Schistocerca americana]XP_047001344.1 HMG box-containing protein 4 [Schistocerca americana]XP_049764322.1 HMG box-containing protein 4 [Schistocerca cancellata]XP_049764329.1 HMG box-containing protein 4 [Schistocerca cancellata]XP_049941070.1 HMG box-containing protein 4 [Schistocerca serialis cubense]XP_049941071.1 HMG box-containing protein 4 [Schistocerca serialis cubense]
MSKMLKRKFDDDMDSTSGGRAKQDELEVTGVSRSGRVRKKSSKLMDFESPDDIDNRYRRRGGDSFSSPVAGSSGGRGRGRASSTLHSDRTTSSSGVHHRDTLSNDGGDDIYSSSDEFTGDVQDDESSSSSSSSSDDEAASDEDRLVEERNTTAIPDESNSRTGDEGPSGSGTASRGGQSLYMLEKSTKKKLVVRDGRVVGRTKAQRKDKGKTRFTAYMLWAKEVRQEILRANPDTDFATISKRLGELWATVPNNEKYAWKRRAKRVALTKPGSDASAQSSVTQGVGGSSQQTDGGRWRTSGSRSKFINKAGGGSSLSGATSGAAARQESGTTTGGMSVTGAVGSGSRSSAGTSASSGSARHHQQQQQQVADSKAGAAAGASGGRGLVAEPAVGPGLYKVVGTQPVDVAAHLKLLGESLGIIGERLKEHEGQIAVSGSLSVLLDSLLCALGPLICLTRQLPETNSCPPEMLSKLLDNIAYFMPGL